MPSNTFQDMISRLERYWADYGCVIMQPYHTEVGAGTFQIRPRRCAASARGRGRLPMSSPRSGRPDGRYGENPFRFQHYFQYQVVLKPAPADLLELYYGSLESIGIDLVSHDMRLVEDNWEGPTLGAWGLGWEAWDRRDGGDPAHVLPAVRRTRSRSDPAEITYGLERLAMFLQGKRSALEIEWAPGVSWGDVYRENERQWSVYNFETAPVETLTRRFAEHEEECRALIEARLPLPAYDQVLKSSHTFNLLDARGAISVTERAAFILRVRELARQVASLYVELEQGSHADAAV